MPVLAESVPGLLHVSLFLFFLGLGDLVSGLNIKVAITTITPIVICTVLYIFTTFAPALYPQSPYQNSFSGLIWYITQTFWGRRYQDRDGEMKSVSGNLAQGQMQLAMEETKERIERDARSIRWLVHGLTEEAEMESLVMTIPGSLNVEWGMEVWKRLSKVISEDANRNTPGSEFATGSPMDANLSTAILPVGRSPRINLVRSTLGSILHRVRVRTVDRHLAMAPLPALHPPDTSRLSNQGDTVVRDLSTRIVPLLLEKCKNRGLFASDEQWRRHTRGCVETTALLVFPLEEKLEWLGDIGKLLRDIGQFENVRKSCLAGIDQSFVTCWTCLSILATGLILKDNLQMQLDLRGTISAMEGPTGGIEQIDALLFDFWTFLAVIYGEVVSAKKEEDLSGVERLKEILRDHQNDLSTFKKMYEQRRSCMRDRDLDPWETLTRPVVHAATQNLICANYPASKWASTNTPSLSV